MAGSSGARSRAGTTEAMPNIAAIVLDPLAKRSGFGTVGKPLKARVNFIKLGLDKDKCSDIVGYHAEHEEKGTKKAVRARFIQRSHSLLLANNSRFDRAASNYGNRIYSQAHKPLVPPNQLIYRHEVDYYEPEESGPRQGSRKIILFVTLQKDADFDMKSLNAYIHNPRNTSFHNIADYIAMVNALLDRVVTENPQLATYARRTKFFDIRVNNGRAALGDGLEAYKGYLKSVRDCIDGLFLNVNTSAGAFFKEGRLDVIMHELRVPPQYLGSVLKRCRVMTSYSGTQRNRAINGLAPPFDRSRLQTANNVRITCPEHGVETVDEHFQRAWPQVQRPNPNALVVDFGNEVYIPADLCKVLPGQPFRGALSGDQTTNMLNFACRKPHQNRDLILREGVPYLRFADNRFGINLANGAEMAQVNARLLPAPNVIFGGNKQESFTDGKWNLRSKKFAQAATTQWLHISYLDLFKAGKPEQPPITPPCQNVKAFEDEVKKGLQSYCGNREAVVKSFPDFKHSQELPENYLKPGGPTADGLSKYLVGEFKKLLGKGIRLVFVMLPDKGVDTYYAVKKAGDLLAGIHTICTVKDKKGIVKADSGTIANLMLKLNQKLGGVNFGFRADKIYADVLGKNAMFVGADVTHPSPAAMIDAPSIAAVVATYDQNFFHYPGILRLQKNKDENKKALEMIEGLHYMMEERLKLYQSKNQGKLPDRIIYVRDGVSDGQFTDIISVEAEKIKLVCKRMYPVSSCPPLPKQALTRSQANSLPKLLVVTTQKRHHTRFFQEQGDKSLAFDKNGNPLPGFTVDTQITSKHHFDWYNTSHACIQGTSRPCKYVVLHDTIGVTADQIQMMVSSELAPGKTLH